MPSARSYSLSELVEATGFDRRTIVYYIQSGLLPKVGRRGPHTRYPDECLVRLLFIKGVRTLQAEGQLLSATLAEMRRALSARDANRIRDLLDRGLPVEELTALFAEEPPAPSRAEPMASPASPPPVEPPPVVAAPTPVTGPSGERRSYGLADAGIRKRFGGDSPAPPPVPELHHEETHPGLPVLDPASFQPPAGVPASPAPVATESSLAETELGELLRELEVRPTLNARRSPPGSPEQWTEIPITSRVYLSVRGLAAEDAPLAEAVARLLKRALRARSSPASA
jgi:DNA-binding transcriptional MerR regulator